MGRRRAPRPRDGARGRPKGKARGKWSAEIRARFLALLRETGNARAALRVVGHPNMFHKRRRSDPAFAAEWAEAVAAADARLQGVESPFPAEGMGTAGMGTVTSNCPRATGPVEHLGDFARADPATLLRPGPKRKPRVRGHAIRRSSNGRVQIALARECEMAAEQEAEFLERLRATGNFSGSARAMGFHPGSLLARARKWPAFRTACDAALDEASVQLDYALVAFAHRLLRTEDAEMGTDAGDCEGMGTVTFTRGGAGFPHSVREGDCPRESDCPLPFDPERAMRILAFLDGRRGRTTRGRRRKGPPDRSFDEAVASVLAKIEAIERHEAMMRERGEGEASPPLDGEG